MKPPLASPPGVETASDLQYIKSLQGLERHLGEQGRHSAHARMLDDMGVDVDAMRAEAAGGTAVFMAEQPGMFPPEYYHRADLVHYLTQAYGLDRARSHPYTLSTDGYSGNGDKERNAKKVFSYVDPMPEYLTEGALLSSAKRKQLNAVGYREIGFPGISGSIRESLQGLLILLEGSQAGSANAFRRQVQKDYKLTERYLDKKQFNNDRELEAYLGSICERLEAFDVGRAIDGVRLYQSRAANAVAGESWASYWTGANDAFYRQTREIEGDEKVIESIDPMLSRFVSYIRDHHKLAKWLAAGMERTGSKPEELQRIPLVGFVDGDTKYKTAFYDMQTGAIYRGRGSSETITWEEIQELAKQEKAVPAYVLKYLMRAGADMYFLIDDVDAKYKTDQDNHIHGIYRSYTDLPYPVLRCPPGGPDANPEIGYSYMGAFGTTDDTRSTFQRVLERLDGDGNDY